MVCERQLHCFRNLLLLNVIASNILFPSHIQQHTVYVTSDFSDCDRREMLESASGGRISTNAFE
ncbi:unnamed protein product [Sphagnum troendelagicum]|uniref:Uncharacterized protein n=2 Tax=Sphagnum TaxID=13804 RepID=A0ABP0V2B4_9BRYO